MKKILLLVILISTIAIKGLLAQNQNYSEYNTYTEPIYLDMMYDDNANFFATQTAFNNYWSGRTQGKGDGWKIFKRWESYWETRVTQDGNMPPANEAMNAYKQMLTAGGPLTSAAGTWTNVGPIALPTNSTSQPNGIGRVNAVAFHPTNSSIIWVGTPAGGLWKSTNGGTSWTGMTDNLPTLGVSSILITPSNTNIMYLGTGDDDGNNAPGLGVYKSTDGGSTWAAANTGITNRRVAEMCFVGSSSSTILAATNRGIYKTTNSGATWIKRTTGNVNFRDIKAKPGSSTIFFATSYSYGSGAKFWRSMNGGNSWSEITIGLSSTSYRMVIGVTAASNNIVYLVAANGNGLVAVYKSTNGGTSFSTASSATTPNILGYSATGNDTRSQASYDLAIAVDPSNANTLYVGGINIWKSTNGGTSWSLNAHWAGSGGVPAVHADHHSLDFSPTGVLFNGNDGGIYKTSNGGTSWTDLSSGLAISQMYKIGQSASNGAMLIAGLQDNGTASVNGAAWSTVIGGDGMECIIDPTNTNYRYGALYYGDIRRSVNGSWFSTIAEDGSNGINESGAWVTPYCLQEGQAGTMFIGYKNVWRSTNIKTTNASSVSWSKISTFTGSTNISVIENSPVDNAVLYVSRGSTIYRTDNANTASATSVSWTNLAGPGGTITDIEAHPTNVNIVYVTANSTTSKQIYKSTNKGVSWTSITGNLPSVSKNCLVYDTTSNEGIYVGTDIGVFYKDASLNNWINFSAGIPTAAEVTDLEIYYSATSPTQSRIKAATYGRGVWSSDLYINPSSPPTADFISSSTNTCSGASIQFTDNTSPTATSWQWNIFPSTVSFVNSTNATSQNPQIQFNATGNYSIQLIASNANGSDTMTKINYISVGSSYTAPQTEDFSTFTTGNPGTWTHGWTFSNTGTFNWRANSGGTASNNTGPSADHTSGNGSGKYLYTEASGPAVAGEVANAISPCISIPNTGSYSLEFYYHLYGQEILGLHVDIFHNGNWINDIHTINGEQHSSYAAAWTKASISLNTYLGNTVKFRFRVIRGSNYRGDVAIDDIFVGVSGTPVTDFSANETTICTNGSVSFTDASTNTPTSWNWTFTPSTVSFIGSTSANSQNPIVKFLAAGTYTAKLVCSNTSGADSLTKTSYITVNAPVSIPNTESFETFTTGQPGIFQHGWTTANIGNFPWYVNNGNTPSNNTGPGFDHTTGTSAGHYLYTEASGITTADIAVLLSPCYDFTSSASPRVSFWYHMFGNDIIALQMDVFHNGVWTNNVKVISGQQQNSNSAPWLQTTVNLDAYANSNVKFRFRVIHEVGSTGNTYQNDVAIDDFKAFNFVPLVNDEPCGAINLPVNQTCTYYTGTNAAATTSIGIPVPGCGGAVISEDVWYYTIVPASGAITIDADPVVGSFNDGVMAIYSGSCTSLSLVSCHDDYQGSGNMPHTTLSNQTPGDTLFIRFWKYGGGTGQFKLCITEPPYFNLSPNTVTLTYAAGTSTINANASSTVTWSVSDNASWLTLSPTTGTGNGTITLSYTANAGASRSATITGISAGLPNQTIIVNQEAYVNANYSNTATMLCTGSSQTFTNTSTNAVSNIWYVNGVQQATTTNLTYTFATAGQYSIKLKVIGAFMNDSITKNFFIGGISAANAGSDTSLCEGGDIGFYPTIATGLVGCNTSCTMPTTCVSTSNNDAQEYITKVKVGSFEHSSTRSGSGYEDNTSSLLAPIHNDSTYLLAITCHTNGNWLEYVDAFVDWNRNGQFDEAAISLGSATFNGSHTFYGFVTPPANAVLGKTKMRVIMRYNGAITGGCYNNYGDGETEDYMIEIIKRDTLPYSWSGPNSFSSTLINPSITNATTAATGTYTLSLSNAYGCTSTDDKIVTVNAVPNVSFAAINDVCQSAASFTLTQGSPAGGTYTGTGVSNGVFSPATAGVGTHTIKYKVIGAGGCADSATQTITVNANPTVSFSGLPASMCINEANVTLSGTPVSGTFSGSGIELTNQFNPSLAGVGTHSIKYVFTDANSCSDSASHNVAVHSLPIVGAGNDTTITYGTKAYLHGSVVLFGGSGNYQWTPAAKVANANSITSYTTNLIATTQFNLLVTNAVTGCSDSDQVVVNITGGPVVLNVSASSDTVCAGDSVQLTALASGGVAAISYSWTSNPSGFTSTIYNPYATPSQSAWYVVSATDGTTTDVDSVYVVYQALPTVNFSIPATICANENAITMTGMTPTGGTFTGTGVSGNSFDPQTSGTGVFPITYTVSGTYGCVGTKVKSITVNAAPTATFSGLSNTACADASNIILTGNPSGGTFSGNGIELQNQFNPSLAGAGTHTIKYVYTNANSCSDSTTHSITVNALPVANAGSDFTITYNTSTSLTASATGLVGAASYSWTPTAMVVSPNSATTNTQVLTSPTEFTVNITDNSTSCSDTDKVLVSISGGPLTLSVSSSDDTICNGQIIQLTALAGGGTVSHNYSWISVPAGFTSTISNPNVSPSVDTWYYITVVNGAATKHDSIFIKVNPLPTVSFNIASQVCISTDTVHTTGVTPIGGIFSGTGMSGSNFIPQTAGAGTFDIIYSYTDANSCSNSDTNSITVNTLPIVSFTGLPNTICSNANNTILSGSPSGGSFYGSGIELFNQFNPSIAGQGSYDITYVFTNVNNCTDSATKTIIVNPAPIVNAGNDTIISYGSTTTLHGQAGGLIGAGSYSWTPANLLVSPTNLTTATNQMYQSAQFNLLVTDQSTNCSDSDQVVVSITGGALSFVISASVDTVCPGDTVQLTALASGGAGTISYLWSANTYVFSSSIFNPKASPSQDTWYKVAVSDNNTTLYDSVFVAAKASPTVNFNIISQVCEGSADVAMTGMTPTGGGFTGNGVSGNTFSPVNAGVGSHAITYLYTDATGCTGSKTKNINVTALPNVVVANMPSVCNSSQTVTLTSGSPYGGTYSGTGVSGIIFDPNIAGTGTHYIHYTFTDQNGCTNNDSNTISVSSSPIANAGADQSISNGSTANLSGSASGGSGNYSYKWTPANMVVNATNSATNTVALNASQIYQLKVTDTQSQCNDSDNVLITVTGGTLYANINISQSPICRGDSTTLNAVGSGGSGNYSYLWTSSPVGFTSSLQNPKVAPNNTTAYLLRIIDGTDTASDGQFVIVDAIPVGMLATDTSICDNSQISLDAGGGYAQYQWSNGASGRFLNIDGSTLPVGKTNFYVTLTNTTGCSAEDSTEVTLNASPKNMLGADTSICQQASITLDGGANMTSYLWSTGDTTQTITISGSMGMGQYTYWVIATNSSDCSGADTLILDVVYCNYIVDLNNDYKVNIYPNPTKGNITINIESKKSDKVNIFVYDNQGRLVSRDYTTIEPGKTNKQLNLNTLAKGLYTIHLQGNNIYQIRKLIIR